MVAERCTTYCCIKIGPMRMWTWHLGKEIMNYHGQKDTSMHDHGNKYGKKWLQPSKSVDARSIQTGVQSFMTDIMILLANIMWAYRICWHTAVSRIKIKLLSITLTIYQLTILHFYLFSGDVVLDTD